MNEDMDFMAIFGGEGGPDLGSGREDFDALFAAEKPAPQPPEEKSPQQAEPAPPETEHDPAPAPAEEPAEPAAEEKTAESQPEAVTAPETKKPTAPKTAGKPTAQPLNPFEVAMRQVEEKITEDLAGELLKKPPVFQSGGVTEEIPQLCGNSHLQREELSVCYQLARQKLCLTPAKLA